MNNIVKVSSKRVLISILLLSILLLDAHRQSTVRGAIAVISDWQDSATGLSVQNNDDRRTAGLGFILQASGWPFISTHGGVRDVGYQAIYGPVGVELGEINIPDSGSVDIAAEDFDWSHTEINFLNDRGDSLKVWVSRLSPGLLIQSTSNQVRFFSGDVARFSFDGGRVTNLSKGPSSPKYVAYSQQGQVIVETLDSFEMPAEIEQNWLLFWYGSDSHIVDTKKPLTYTGTHWKNASLPHSEAYQADVPILLKFENKPQQVSQSLYGGFDIEFENTAGYIKILPLFGRDHPRSSDTESWYNSSIPPEDLNRISWWLDHVCSFPVTVQENYSYSSDSDSVSISENIGYVNICGEGQSFAPIPPVLGIVKDILPVTFSGPINDPSYPTEFGPLLGIENVSSYSWTVRDLSRYIDAKRISLYTGEEPQELEDLLENEIRLMIDSGHYAPWIFSDTIPRHNIRGDIYWLNPADVIFHLVEIAETLSGDLKSDLINYISQEISMYPPEIIMNLPLDEGKVRDYFSLSGDQNYDIWADRRRDVFLERLPIYNFYSISRYLELINGSPSQQTYQKAVDALNNDLSEQDWATFYWFDGFDDRRVAVINANRYFAGIIGYTRLAQLVGDSEGEGLGRAFLAKAAVLRLSMALYPRHLYESNLIELPVGADWQIRYNAGRYPGYIFTYQWDTHDYDHRQVAQLNQFGVYLNDHSGFQLWEAGVSSPYLIAFRDIVPELGRFLSDYALQEVGIYIRNIETMFPHWYVAFAEGVLGEEHNLSHPIDSVQLFLAKSYIQEEIPDSLATFIDIPWLLEADLFYIHKLSETIKRYRGITWDDNIDFRANASD